MSLWIFFRGINNICKIQRFYLPSSYRPSVSFSTTKALFLSTCLFLLPLRGSYNQHPKCYSKTIQTWHVVYLCARKRRRYWDECHCVVSHLRDRNITISRKQWKDRGAQKIISTTTIHRIRFYWRHPRNNKASAHGARTGAQLLPSDDTL